jgi:hypothetical protein
VNFDLQHCKGRYLADTPLELLKKALLQTCVCIACSSVSLCDWC